MINNNSFKVHPTDFPEAFDSSGWDSQLHIHYGGIWVSYLGLQARMDSAGR